jgi:hypothetical protein
MKEPKAPTPHPYDTNEFLDLPEGKTVEISITWGDRIRAVCQDVHHCTIANAISRQAKVLGVMEMGPRGVSKRYVSMLLDPAIHPWAEEGRWYRGMLGSAAANIVAELDINAATPTIEKQNVRGWKQQVKTMPEGEDTVWMIITVMPPTQKKGYRSGENRRGKTGPGNSKRSTGYTRRRYKPDPKVLQ